MSNTVVKICRFKGKEDRNYITEDRKYITGECYLVEITESETISPNGMWRRIIVNHAGKTSKIYKTFVEFLEEWEIIGEEY